MTCCSGCTGYPAAERYFGVAVATRDLKRYRRKSPDATSRLLLGALTDHVICGDSLLDIGGGVGILDFELLAKGVSRATLLDASPAYLDAAREEAERRGLADLITSVTGDFTRLADSIHAANVVTLHRVICCYADYATLLEGAARHSLRVLAFSYPRDRWYARWAVRFENAARRMRGNDFRAFVHLPVAIERIVERAGFRRVNRRQTLAWCIDVYVRDVCS
jgi:ubiquinone/menaquinone biosynthesis C-methylase UbiE